MNYEQKYLKYKNKYLDLKQDIFTQGGSIKNKYLDLKGQIGGVNYKQISDYINKPEFLENYALIDISNILGGLIVTRKKDGITFKIDFLIDYPHYPDNPPKIYYNDSILDHEILKKKWTNKLKDLLDIIVIPDDIKKNPIEIIFEYLKNHPHIGKISKLKVVSSLATDDEFIPKWYSLSLPDQNIILDRLSTYLTEKNHYPTIIRSTPLGGWPFFYSETHLLELARLFNCSREEILLILSKFQNPNTVEMDIVHIAFGDLNRSPDDPELEYGLITPDNLTSEGKRLYAIWIT